jgi:hypothetical protein
MRGSPRIERPHLLASPLDRARPRIRCASLRSRAKAFFIDLHRNGAGTGEDRPRQTVRRGRRRRGHAQTHAPAPDGARGRLHSIGCGDRVYFGVVVPRLSGVVSGVTTYSVCVSGSYSNGPYSIPPVDPLPYPLYGEGDRRRNRGVYGGQADSPSESRAEVGAGGRGV